jgi:hypothetical protein
MSSWYTDLCPAGTRVGSRTINGVICVNDSDTKTPQCPSGSLETYAGSTFCVSPSGTSPKQCPSGYDMHFDAEGTTETCRKVVPASCPAGSTQTDLSFPPRQVKTVCLKPGAPTYSRPMPTSDAEWPCNGTDPLSLEFAPDDGSGARTPPTGIKCYGGGSSGGGSAQTAPATPPFETNDAAYQQQVAEYEAMLEASIRQNDPTKLPDLRTKSEAIQSTLNKMIENLTYLKKETPDIRSQRDSLLEKLRRIQQDYSAMLVNTDDLETLRRIRQEENGEAKRLLMMYLLAFLFVCTMLIIYLMYTGRKTPTSQTTAPTPTMSPALT